MARKNIYEEYVESEKLNKERNDISKKYNIDKDNVIVSKEKPSKIRLFFSSISSLGYRIFKIVFYIIIFLLVTIGSTVLINSSLRTELINIFMQNM